MVAASSLNIPENSRNKLVSTGSKWHFLFYGQVPKIHLSSNFTFYFHVLLEWWHSPAELLVASLIQTDVKSTFSSCFSISVTIYKSIITLQRQPIISIRSPQDNRLQIFHQIPNLQPPPLLALLTRFILKSKKKTLRDFSFWTNHNRFHCLQISTVLVI